MISNEIIVIVGAMDSIHSQLNGYFITCLWRNCCFKDVSDDMVI